MITNCIHLSNGGRKLKAIKAFFFSINLISIDISTFKNNHHSMHSIEQHSKTNATWVENLAMDEINMDESGVIDLHEHLNPIHFLEESSINLMNELRDLTEYYVGKFNEYRGQQPSSHIKIFKISNTVNDFMLFRNSLRLIFARKSNDIINIGFISNGKELVAPRLTIDDQIGSMAMHEIKAHIGPFHNISWHFQGETFDTKIMIKHYLTEFIKQSAR